MALFSQFIDAQDKLLHHYDVHIHTVNMVGGVIFLGAVGAHMPTLAYYTASVGAVWYSLLAIRLVIQSCRDVASWCKRFRTKKG